MYTYKKGSLLRLYGVLVGNNAMIITGGGIKLVDKMQDVEALKLELAKMTYLIDWLKIENITNASEL